MARARCFSLTPADVIITIGNMLEARDRYEP